jgi:NAD(P)-dependent dehydrogenase (short-subunit alcohol dehydrogenase family)
MTDTTASPSPRTAIVTGAASGIGAATLLALAREGYSTVGIDIARDGAEAVTREAATNPGTRHLAIVADVSDEPAIVAAFDAALKFLGRLDVLVTSAGVGETTPFMEIDVATFRAVHEVNVIGTFLCIREAARRMQAGARICTVSSVAGLRGGGLSGTAAYAASKGAVLALTKNAARALAPQGIAVNTVAPGATLTPMIAEHWKNAAHRARVEGMSVLNRTAEASEIAAAIAFLVSPQAASITGSTLVADNGLVMH